MTGERSRTKLWRLLSTPHRSRWLSAGPAAVWLGLLLLAPLTYMVVVSFLSVSEETYQLVWSPTLEAYGSLFNADPVWTAPFVDALLISVFVAVVTTLLCLVTAFPVAYLLARREGRWVRVTFFLVLLPFFTMYLVRAYSWMLVFGKSGVLNTTLQALGLVGGPVGLFTFGLPAIIVGLTHAYFPYMLLSLYASLDGIDMDLVAVARDLGATRVAVVRDVLVPLTLPGMVSGGLFVFVPTLGAFVTPDILGAGKIQMIGNFIEGRILGAADLAAGSAAAMFIVVAIVLVFAVVIQVVDPEELGAV